MRMHTQLASDGEGGGVTRLDGTTAPRTQCQRRVRSATMTVQPVGARCTEHGSHTFFATFFFLNEFRTQNRRLETRHITDTEVGKQHQETRRHTSQGTEETTVAHTTRCPASQATPTPATKKERRKAPTKCICPGECDEHEICACDEHDCDRGRERLKDKEESTELNPHEQYTRVTADY